MLPSSSISLSARAPSYACFSLSKTVTTILSIFAPFLSCLKINPDTPGPRRNPDIHNPATGRPPIVHCRCGTRETLLSKDTEDDGEILQGLQVTDPFQEVTGSSPAGRAPGRSTCQGAL